VALGGPWPWPLPRRTRLPPTPPSCGCRRHPVPLRALMVLAPSSVRPKAPTTVLSVVNHAANFPQLLRALTCRACRFRLSRRPPTPSRARSAPGSNPPQSQACGSECMHSGCGGRAGSYSSRVSHTSNKVMKRLWIGSITRSRS